MAELIFKIVNSLFFSFENRKLYNACYHYCASWHFFSFFKWRLKNTGMIEQCPIEHSSPTLPKHINILANTFVLRKNPFAFFPVLSPGRSAGGRKIIPSTINDNGHHTDHTQTHWSTQTELHRPDGDKLRGQDRYLRRSSRTANRPQWRAVRWFRKRPGFYAFCFSHFLRKTLLRKMEMVLRPSRHASRCDETEPKCAFLPDAPLADDKKIIEKKRGTQPKQTADEDAKTVLALN